MIDKKLLANESRVIQETVRLVKMAHVTVKFAPQLLTSTACMSSSCDAIAEHIGRFATLGLLVLFSRAFLILSTCCLFFKTLSGSGPAQRGSL
eukprot:4494068-Pleurochrysis_carterae.AAC.1